MTRPTCRHFRKDECRLGFYGGRPSPGVCGQCESRDKMAAVLRTQRWGLQVRDLIHSVLDGIESVIHLFVRSRYHLGWIEKIKGCGGCGGRERWIDRHVRPDRWADKMVRIAWRRNSA